jgi:hypothetical protein
MELLKAAVVQIDEKHFIEIKDGDSKISIPISEDKPKEVKAAFNALIARIKTGVFQVELEGIGNDLFYQVAKEYIIQLNREIEEVYGEMKQYGLAAKPPTPPEGAAAS